MEKATGETSNTDFDLVVIGAGSGGIGAALAAGRLGLNVLLVERSDKIGGNAAVSGVSVWEMGVGGTGIPFDIYRELKQIPQSVGIYTFNRHCAWKDENGQSQFPAGAELTLDPNLKYVDSLRRYGARSLADEEEFVRRYWHGVPFEPAIYQEVVERMMQDTGRITILKNTAFTEANCEDGKLTSVVLSNGQTIKASYFIDATNGGYLCQACACETLFGQEGKEKFNEPDAPEHPTQMINGVSLIFRISPQDHAAIEPLPAEIPSDCWWRDEFPLTSMVQYPNGDFNINMLPTMGGEEFMAWDKSTVYEECRKRSWAHWHYLQTTYPEFQYYRRSYEFIALGVRETHRIVGEYVLTEHDLLQGINRQSHPDIIALSDHPMDLHGIEKSGCTELEQPYGIPYRCLIPKGFSNLLIASRSASFSSLAASSCRLSRTMMQLGQAAGTAAYLARQSEVSLPALDPAELRAQLKQQHVQLTWPMPEALFHHLQQE